MIIDNETNFLWLADSLNQKRYSTFLTRFEKVLNTNNISYNFLKNTKDIWAVDYMPIQISENKYIKFIYNPDYLRNDKKLRETISDVDSICDNISVKSIKSAILVDGGNVIRTKNKVIMCDKVFNENRNIPQNILSNLLADIFEIEKVIFIPSDPDDFTGHADGMVRFIDKDYVFINSYTTPKPFHKKLKKILIDEGLECLEIPYNPDNNKHDDQAQGIYINYLQMHDVVFVPTFGMKEDDISIKIFEQHFKTVVPVDSNEIANDGGILNCISWNIWTKKTPPNSSLA
jgi:agmatine deiminase